MLEDSRVVFESRVLGPGIVSPFCTSYKPLHRSGYPSQQHFWDSAGNSPLRLVIEGSSLSFIRILKFWGVLGDSTLLLQDIKGSDKICKEGVMYVHDILLGSIWICFIKIQANTKAPDITRNVAINGWHCHIGALVAWECHIGTYLTLSYQNLDLEWEPKAGVRGPQALYHHSMDHLWCPSSLTLANQCFGGLIVRLSIQLWAEMIAVDEQYSVFTRQGFGYDFTSAVRLAISFN